MHKSLFTVIVLTLALSSELHATTQIPASTVTTIGTYTGVSGALGAYVTFSPAIPGLEGCSNTTGNEVWIDFSSTTQPDGKTLYATILAAFLAGHTVGFGVNTCVQAGQMPLVYRVDVYP